MSGRVLVFLVCLVLLTGCYGYGGDPYVQQGAAQGAISATEAALRSTVLVQSVRATATAQEESARWTATAGALQWERLAGQATGTARAADVTSTAQAVQATGTAQAAAWFSTATQSVRSTGEAIVATEAAYQRERDEQAATVSHWADLVWRVALPAGLLVLLVVAVWVVVDNRAFTKRALAAWEVKARRYDQGDHKPPMFVLSVGGRDVVVRPDLQFGPALELSASGSVIAGCAPSLALQGGVAARQAAVDLVAALPRGGDARRAARLAGSLPQKDIQEAARLEDSQTQPAGDMAEDVEFQLPAGVSWEGMVSGWHGVGLPLGVGNDGVIAVDSDGMRPHLLFAGSTGSGKTRFGLRPLAAAALAAGWRVTVLDPSMGGFQPFEGATNAHLVEVDGSEDVVGYLESLYQFILGRNKELAAARCSLWSRMPGAGPRELVIVDEFSDLAYGASRKLVWDAARLVANEGRKAGVVLALAVQNPSYESIDLGIRRQMTPVAFALGDRAASQLVLNAPGAEGLPVGQFLARVGNQVVRGAGFAPGDEELGRFCGALRVREYGRPEWLALPDGAGGSPAGGVDDQAAKIRELASQGMSKNKIQDMVFGYRGGAAYAATTRAMAEMVQ